MNFDDLFIQATFLDAINQPIFARDLYGRYIYCNQAFADFLDLRVEEIINRMPDDISSIRLTEIDSQNNSDHLNNRLGISRTITSKGVDGGERVKVVFKKSILYGSDRALSGYVGTLEAHVNLINREGNAVKELTDREVEILNLLAQGCSVKTMAKLLNISHHTITDHLKSIYRKLKVHSKNEAIYKALSLFSAHKNKNDLRPD